MEQYFASGVWKLAIEKASFKDLKSMAQKWAQDPCFYELIIRKVSDKDFGIQFVYVAKGEDHKNISEYERELREEFGDVKAVDLCERTSNDPSENIFDGIVKLQSLR